MAFNIAGAKAAGYSDEEINAYLASKSTTKPSVLPKTAATPIPVKQPKQENFLSRLVRPTVEAFKGTARNIGTVGQVMQSSLMSPFAPQAAARLASVKSPFVLDQPELEEIEKQPMSALGRQAKRSAIIASYAVPVGGTANIAGKTVALTPFKGGAVAGGLYGAGQEEASLGSIIASSLLGGAAAHILSKVPFLGKSVKEKGEKIAAGKIVLKRGRVTPQFAQKEQEVASLMSKHGVVGNAEKKAFRLGQKYGDYVEQLDDAIKGIQTPVNSGNIVNNAVKSASLKTDITKGVGKNNVDFWTQRLGQTNNWDALNKLKFELQGKIPWGKGNLTDEQQVILAFHNSIDDVIKNVSPEVKQIMSNLRDLQIITPTIEKATKEANLSLGSLLVSGIKIPGTRGFIQGTRDITGRGIQKVGGGVGALFGGVPPDVGSIIGARAPQFLQGLGIQLGDVSPEVKDFGDQVIGPEEFTAEFKRVLGDMDKQTQPENQGIKITRAQMQAVLLSEKIKPATKNSVMQAYKLQQGSSLTGAEKTQLNTVKTGLILVDQIQKNYENLQRMGLTAEEGDLGRISGFLKGKTAAIRQKGTKGAAAASYEKTTEAFLSMLTRAVGQTGVLTETDLSLIRNAIPSFSDTPETAKMNFDTVKSILQARADAFVENKEDESEDIF